MAGFARRTAASGAALALVLGLGCGRPRSASVDELTRQVIGLVNDQTAILEKVKDEAGAKAAIPQVQDLTVKIEEMRSRANAMKSQLTPQQQSDFVGRHEAEIKQAERSRMKEVLRVATIPGAAELLKALQPRTS